MITMLPEHIYATVIEKLTIATNKDTLQLRLWLEGAGFYSLVYLTLNKKNVELLMNHAVVAAPEEVVGKPIIAIGTRQDRYLTTESLLFNVPDEPFRKSVIVR